MEYLVAETNRLGNRRSNQDRFGAIETDEGVLLVLADGMGGQACGEVAAEFLVDSARQAYLNIERPVNDPYRLFHNIVMSAHESILRYGQAQIPPVTPGTTAVLCLVEGGKATWAHAGDSRLYVFQGGLPTYRTTDHSYVEELYQKGEISRFEQETHPMRNQITQCIGCQAKPPKLTFSHTIGLNEGDVVLLCSDGLWGALDDVQMGAELNSGALQQTIESLAEKAELNSYPSSDNISVVALRLLAHSEPVQTDEEVADGEQAEKSHSDEVRLAIDQIEAVMKEYEDEFEK